MNGIEDNDNEIKKKSLYFLSITVTILRKKRREDKIFEFSDKPATSNIEKKEGISWQLQKRQKLQY